MERVGDRLSEDERHSRDGRVAVDLHLRRCHHYRHWVHCGSSNARHLSSLPLPHPSTEVLDGSERGSGGGVQLG